RACVRFTSEPPDGNDHVQALEGIRPQPRSPLYPGRGGHASTHRTTAMAARPENLHAGRARARVRGGARHGAPSPRYPAPGKAALVHCHQGRGTFVAEKPPSRHWLELATDWAILIDSIKDNIPKRIKVDHPPAYPELHEGEGALAPEYRFIRSLQYKDGEPY